jgi:phosphatidylglycerophosphate synthase
MIARAIVVVPPTSTAAELQRPIAGVPVLLRLLLSAQRAGVGAVLLLGLSHDTPWLAELLRDRRLLLRVLCLEDGPWAALLGAAPELEKAWWEGDLWVLPGGGVVDVALLRDAAQQPIAEPIATLETWPAPAPPQGPPFYRVAGSCLRAMLEAAGDEPLSSLLMALPQRGPAAQIANRGRVCLPAVAEEMLAAVERGLLAGLGSAADGWVDRHLNRQLSPWISRWLLRTPLTPNHVTLLSLAVGLAAAGSIAQGGWLGGVIGAVLLQGAAVLDCCDGEVARLKFLESPGGYYLDIAGDNLVHVAVFLAVAWSSAVSLPQGYAVWLGGASAGGTLLAFAAVLTMRHGRARPRSARLDRLIDSLTNRDFSLLLLLCALAGQLEWFLWALAIGVNLFWPSVLALSWRGLRRRHG